MCLLQLLQKKCHHQRQRSCRCNSTSTSLRDVDKDSETEKDIEGFDRLKWMMQWFEPNQNRNCGVSTMLHRMWLGQLRLQINDISETYKSSEEFVWRLEESLRIAGYKSVFLIFLVHNTNKLSLIGEPQ